LLGISSPTLAQFAPFFCPPFISELLVVLEFKGIGYFIFNGPRPFTQFRRATIVDDRVICSYLGKNNQIGTATLHTLRKPKPDLQLANNWQTIDQIIAGI
jgi:hypothetical protein